MSDIDLARKRAIAFGLIPAEGESPHERDMRRAAAVIKYGKPRMRQIPDGRWQCASKGVCTQAPRSQDSYMHWLLLVSRFPQTFPFELFAGLAEQPPGAQRVIDAGNACMKRWLNG